MAKTTERVSDAAETMRPYVERALKDERVRNDVKNAIAAARAVYSELLGGTGVAHVATRVATDKEVQDNLRSAIDDLRRAADRIQGKDEHKARNTLLLLTGLALGALFNPVTGPGTRKWLGDKVFGGGGADEFSYQPSSMSDSPGGAMSDSPGTSTADSSTTSMPDTPPGSTDV